MKHARPDYDERIQDSAGLIPEDEPVVFIRGHDVGAMPAVGAWLLENRRQGASREVIELVEEHLRRIEAWQRDVKVKVPDLPAAEPEEDGG